MYNFHRAACSRVAQLRSFAVWTRPLPCRLMVYLLSVFGRVFHVPKGLLRLQVLPVQRSCFRTSLAFSRQVTWD